MSGLTRSAADPLTNIGKVAGAVVGAALGAYAGLNLLIPLGFALLVGGVLAKTVSGKRRLFIVALSIQAGHALWMMLGALILKNWEPVFFDLLIIVIGLAWLLIFPGIIPVVLLSIYQLAVLGLNIHLLMDMPVGSNLHKAISVHVALRVVAIGALGYALYRSWAEGDERSTIEQPTGTLLVETFNPYQSPSAAALSLGEVIAGPGPWRHGNDLVVRIGQSQLPPFCVKSNLPTEGNIQHLDLEWVPNQGVWVILFGAIGHWVARSLYGVKIPLDLPLAKQWIDERRKATRPGWLALAFGAFCLIGGTMIYIFVIAAGVPEQSAIWLMIPIFCGPLIAIGGLIYLFFRDRSLLTLRKVDGPFAWLSGAHHDYLSRLPYWE